ncbi:MAG: alcohol dehydrogenase catalytic domain-containing protein [Acidobacteriaceae bacterium]|nr:alcohol dehydrogenase catalytic domain-containing protein [Acidobacteriaceae bacterium]
MRAVYLSRGQVSVEEVPPPQRPPGFALIRTLAAGICNTDLELQRGYYQFEGIPGHEFVGEVLESDSKELIGCRVAGEINLSCGHCDYCILGSPRHCENRSVLGIVKHPGAFAELLTLPDKNLHIVPSEIPDEEAVFVEPLAAARAILDQVVMNIGEQVAVLGDGKLGLLVAQALHVHGARVTVFGHHSNKLSIVATRGITVSKSYPHSYQRFQYVVECTGSAAGLSTAIQMAEPRGVIIMKSTVHEKVTIDMAPVVVNEIALLGSRCGRFEPAIQLLRDRKIDVRPMLSAEFPLEQAPAAFAEAARKGVLKVILRNV